MMGPDYTHWHGMYDIAENFYYHFLPELMKLAKKKGKEAMFKKEVDAVLARPEHQWYKKGFDADVMKAIQAEQKERYKQ